jgi:hypothetical protein
MADLRNIMTEFHETWWSYRYMFLVGSNDSNNNNNNNNNIIKKNKNNNNNKKRSKNNKSPNVVWET